MSLSAMMACIAVTLLACGCNSSKTDDPRPEPVQTGACGLVSAGAAADAVGSTIRKSEESSDKTLGILGYAYYGVEFGPILHTKVTHSNGDRIETDPSKDCVPVATSGATGSICSDPEGASSAVVRATWNAYRLDAYGTRTGEAPLQRDQLIDGLQAVVADLHANLTAESFHE